MIASNKRQKIEEKFHDDYAAEIKLDDLDVKENFSFAAQENCRAYEIFGNLKGKKILDLGCGSGESAVFWASKGAQVDAVDISEKMIRLGQGLAKKHNVSKNCIFAQMTAENLKFPSKSFDFVFGNGVLHHIDIPQSSKEIHRTLKDGGKAVFVEPLAYNPAIEVYRKIAEGVRTPTESPIKFEDIAKLKKLFTKVSHEEYELFTLLVFVWFFLVARVSPNDERYWRKILQVKGNLKIILKALIGVDKVVLKLLPPLRYLCWNTVIILEK